MSLLAWTLDIPKFLVISTTFGFFGLLALLFFVPFPPESKEILNITLGSVGTAWLGIVNYNFGSSSGSAKKTDAMLKKEGNGQP